MNYRFSGHETFPCRYAWLPKAYRCLTDNPRIFGNEEDAIVAMGVGKNMVRAIRFWVQTAGVAVPQKDGGYSTTEFGKSLLKPEGLDPFLEDKRTLWLIHWKLSTHIEEPLFAWDYLLNRWRSQEISRTLALRAFQQEVARLERKLSSVTLEQHFDTFLHTYVPTRSRKGEILEDNLDCPLVELELIQKIGERDYGGGRREPIYAFRRESKPDITPELFLFCLNEFWTTRKSTEKKISFREISVGHGSPGQIFKLDEWDLRERLDRLEHDSHGLYIYRESAALQEVVRANDTFLSDGQLLNAVYGS